MSITVPPRKRIPKCEKPSDVKGNAIDWIKQFNQRRVQNCDIQIQYLEKANQRLLEENKRLLEGIARLERLLEDL